ncbi:Anaphase-promoting complex subunit 11 [Entamoeba marina]
MSMEILEWNEIASWEWNLAEDICGICQTSFDYSCPVCIYPGEECPPITGVCGHSFHSHCLDLWLKTNRTCPICRRPWNKTQE